jgi:hypothetical protein
MQTFPVFATIVASYRFLLRELPTIVRLTWAPLAIVAIIQYLSARHVLSGMALPLALGDVTAGTRGAYAGWIAFRIAVEMIGTAVVAVPLHELVLFGDRKPGAYLYAAFGMRELRFTLLSLAFGLTGFIGLLLIVESSGKGYAPIIGIAAILVMLYLSTRLWPILPIIVVKNRFEVREAWELTRGRFWSMAALGIVGMLPALLLAGIISSALPDLESIAASHVLSEKRHMVELAQRWLPLRSALDFVLAIINTAIGVALISYGYKALTGHRFEERLAPVAVAGK